MALSEADERRIEAEVAGMIAELRAQPSQEKEDRIGLAIAVMPDEERALVPTVLLRFIVAERRSEPLPDGAPFAVVPPRTRNRFGWTLRFPRG